MNFTAIAAWAKPATPNRVSLYEVFALLGLEGKWARLSAADQRAIIGYPVFGKQLFRVNEDGAVEVRRVTCYGKDYEQGEYSPARIRDAAGARKRLSPGVSGPGYYKEPDATALAA